MSKPNTVLALWDRCEKLPMGAMIFTRLFCLRVPYFASIRPRFVSMRPGYCEVRMNKRRRVLNHLGTIHAIALCNLAELAGGTMSEVSVPRTHRWIPKGMTVEYTGKAHTGVRAVAQWVPMPEFGEAAEIPVEVHIRDEQEQLVLHAVITMWVTPKKPR